MRINEQVASIESETERLLGEIRSKLGGYKFRRLGTRQFEDLGKVYERRGGPFAKKFLESKNRESKGREERDDLQRLGQVLDLVQGSNLDIHMKAFVLRKLPVILNDP